MEFEIVAASVAQKEEGSDKDKSGGTDDYSRPGKEARRRRKGSKVGRVILVSGVDRGRSCQIVSPQSVFAN